MVDNVTADAGAGGAVFATDDIGAVHHPFVKLEFGPLDTATIVTATEGLPVTSENFKLTANDGVDIGDVDVTSVIPGTGATNLGKAIDSPVGGTDTGVLFLGVHDAEASKISVAEEDYDHLHIGELGGLSVEPEQHNHLDEMDATAGWAALGNDTLNLATTTNHLTGTNALTFDKVDGAANTVIAGIDKTITSVNMGELDLHDIVQTVCFLSSIALVDYVFVRIGTDSTNYNEWRVPDTELTAGEFVILGLSVGAASQTGATGNGVRWDDIKYIAVGVAFDAETNTLSGIIFDQLGIFTGHHTTASLSSEVSTSLNTSNINLQKIGGSVVTKGAGNASNGSQRIVIATDDVNLAAIKTSVEIIDDWDETNRAAVNIISGQVGVTGGSGVTGAAVQRVVLATDVALPAGTNAIGKLSANSGVDIGDVDVTSISAGSNLIGDVGVGVRTSGGTTLFKNIDVDETEDEIKATAGQVYWIHAINLKASVLFLKFYNATAASVTVGTTVPDLTFPIPTQGDTNGAGFTLSITNGIAFSTAITIACTTGIADNDSGAPGANECIVNLGFS